MSTNSLCDRALEQGGRVLRLAPNCVPRSFPDQCELVTMR